MKPENTRQKARPKYSAESQPGGDSSTQTRPPVNQVARCISDLKRFASLDPDECQAELALLLRRDHGDPYYLASSIERLKALRNKVSDRFIGRREAVNACLASLISGVPLVMLGPPGTAKSAIARTIADLCGLAHGKSAEARAAGVYFEYLLTSHTMPEELFGSPKLELLREGVYERNIDGMLPEAEIAFLDEIFRGGGHILNTLLSLVNERVFHDGSKVVRVPLLAILAAANHPPMDPDVEAFYDRFPIRVWLRSILQINEQLIDRDRRVRTGSELLGLGLDGQIAQLQRTWSGDDAAGSKTIELVACTNDIRAARTHVLIQMREGDPAAAREEFDDLFHRLRDRCRLSDRSYVSLWQFGWALNALETDTENPSGHMHVFNLVAPDVSECDFVHDVVNQYMHGRGRTSDE